MSKKYQIFFLIALILLIAGVGFFLYQKYQPVSEENEIFSLPEEVVLTESQQEKFDKAKQDLKTNPNDHLALIAIAQVKYQVQDLDGAEKVYLMALEIQPTNTVILNNLGDIYNQKKEYEKSAEMYLTIIENNPNWRNAYRELKTLYRFHLKEKYPQIEGLLLKAIEDNKKVFGEAPVDFYAMLAVYYKDTGQKEKAIPYYEKVLELNPNNEGAKIDLEELKKSN